MQKKLWLSLLGCGLLGLAVWHQNQQIKTGPETAVHPANSGTTSGLQATPAITSEPAAHSPQKTIEPNTAPAKTETDTTDIYLSSTLAADSPADDPNYQLTVHKLDKPRLPTAREQAWHDLVQRQYQWPFTELLLWMEGQQNTYQAQQEEFWTLAETDQSQRRQQIISKAVQAYPELAQLQVMHIHCRGHRCEVLGLAPDRDQANRFFALLRDPQLLPDIEEAALIPIPVRQSISFQLYMTFKE